MHNGLTKAFAIRQDNSDKFMVYGWGQLWLYDLKYYSDSTLKKNITPLGSVLNKLMQVKGYTY